MKEPFEPVVWSTKEWEESLNAVRINPKDSLSLEDRKKILDELTEMAQERGEYGIETRQGPHPLQSIFNDAILQVTSGKGQERHGDGKEFFEQPWKHLADVHGRGFLTGQAAKKLEEAQRFTDRDKWKREMLGAIVYAAMAVLYGEESD